MALSDKFRIKDITGPFDADNEGTVKDERGSLVQIIDGRQTFSHLVFLDLMASDPPVYRGAHYHRKKLEIFYIISGVVEAQLHDLDTGQRETLTLYPGFKLTLLPGLAHRFRALEYARIIEASPDPYDPDDVFPFDF